MANNAGRPATGAQEHPIDAQNNENQLAGYMPSSLRSRLASGARWTISIRVVERVIGFVSTLILARLLSPSDFGAVAMGTAIQGILAGVTAVRIHAGPDQHAPAPA